VNVTVELSGEFDQFVNGLVKSGVYATHAEVVREALQLLKDREFLREYKLRSLRKEIGVAEQQFKDGRYKTYQSDGLRTLTQSVKKEGRKRLDPANYPWRKGH